MNVYVSISVYASQEHIKLVIKMCSGYRSCGLI